MKKNAYEAPEIEIQMLEDADFVITTSGIDGGDEVTNPDPWFDGDF